MLNKSADSSFMQVNKTHPRFCFDPSSVRWVLTDDDLASLSHVLQFAPLVVLDLETTGLDEHARAGGESNGGVPARVSLASLTIPRGSLAHEGLADTWVIPLSHPAGPFANRWRKVLTQIASEIELNRIPLVNQHVKFDCRWIYAATGVDLSKLIIWDTAVSSHLLDENSSTKLKERAPATFGITRWDDFDLSTPGASERVPIFDLGMYAARDTYWTFALYVLHSEWMFLDIPGVVSEQDSPETPEDIENARLGLIAKYVAMPAVAALTALEQTGIVIDATWIREKIAVSESARDRLTEELTHWFDGSVESEELAILLPPDSVSFAPTSNWFKSWIDLALRFGDLRIAELTPAGKPSWGKSVLARQARDGGSLAAEKLLELRSHVKQLEFLNSWQSLGVVHSIPGIVEETTIHAQYNIGGHAYSRVQYHNAGAAPKTGRLSSSNPNMQQVTHDLRAAFIPRPGMVFVDLDYSQIELRVVSHIAKCIPMIDAFKRGDDLHRLLAARISGKPLDEVTPSERQAGKCFHPDTEVLTRSGWKKILDLSEGEEIVQGHPQDDGSITLSWVTPWQVYSQKNEHDYLVELRNEGMDLLVTPDHALLSQNNKGQWERRMPQDMNAARYWYNAGQIDGEREVDSALLRVAVMVQADGSYESGRVRLGFTKARKIKRCRALLTAAKIEFSESTAKITRFSFKRKYIEHLLDQKKLPWWWLTLTTELREVVLDEAWRWDGTKATNWRAFRYDSQCQQNIDVMQALAALTGRKTNNYGDGRLSVRDTDRTRGGNLDVKVVPYAGLVACLAVDSTVVLIRRGGKVQITHQSANFGLVYGMSAEGFQNYADTAYGVSLTYDEAVHFRKTFFDLWEGLLEWHNSSALRVARTGQVVSPIGRVRRLTSALSGNDRDVAAAVRAGINAPVQGMASDIMMIALASISGTLPCLLGKFLESYNGPVHEYSKPLTGVVPIASVHDSLVAEITFMNWETPVRECLSRMLNVGIVLEHLGCRFDVPLAVEAKIGTRWGLSDIGTMSADNRGGTINFY